MISLNNAIIDELNDSLLQSEAWKSYLIAHYNYFRFLTNQEQVIETATFNILT